MIENIRKYTWLIVIVIVVLVFGFILMDTNGVFSRAPGGGGDFIQIEGRTYSQAEFNRLSRYPLGVIPRLRGFDANSLEIGSRFAGTLIGGAQSEEVALQNFFAGRVVLQDAFDEFGIHPSEEEIDEFIMGLSAFHKRPPIGSPPGTTTGEFDQVVFNNFVDNGLGGMKEKDFRELIRDVIATSKLRSIIGSGLTVDREFAKATAILNSQQVEVSVAPIEIETFRNEIEPSEEDLKGFWEEVKDGYMTEQRIKVSYFIASPEYAEETEEGTEEAVEGEETDSGEEEEADTEKEEARAQAEKELAIAIDTFVNTLTDADGANFDELIENSDWELVSTDWFTPSTVPEELKIQPRATSAGQPVSSQLFSLSMGPDELSPFSKAIAVGESQWLLARLDELEDPRVKTFEEAREAIEERYIEEKAEEALKKHVEEKLEQIKKALAEDKSFADAAKEAGLETTELGPFGPSDTLGEGYRASDLYSPASTVNPGELAEPVYTDKQAIILLVKNREIIKDDNRGQQIDAAADRLARENASLAFDAWLTQRLKEAEVIDLTSRI